jgi:hypothetical protein
VQSHDFKPQFHQKKRRKKENNSERPFHFELFFSFCGAGIKPSTSCMLSQCFTTELHLDQFSSIPERTYCGILQNS